MNYKLAVFLVNACILLNVYAMPTLEENEILNQRLEKNPEEGEYFEGDIMGAEFETVKGVAQLITGTRTVWPNGVVPYKITDGAYNSTQIDKILEGMRFLENSTKVNGKTCVQFVPYTNQANWIRIYNGTGCSSVVGKNTSPGEQLVSLKKPTPGSTSTCLTTGIVAHELIHALGFWHEQSRPDRDSYINILWENIQVGTEHNFNKYTTGVDLLGFPYDFESIMHYGPTSFGIGGATTIQPKVSGVTIGQRTYLSKTDIGEIQKYYKCV